MSSLDLSDCPATTDEEIQHEQIRSFAVSPHTRRRRLFLVVVGLFSIGIGELLLTFLCRGSLPALPYICQGVEPLGWRDLLVLLGGLAVCFGPQVLTVSPWPKEVHVLPGGLKVIFRHGEDLVPWENVARVRIGTWRQAVVNMTIKPKSARTLQFRDFDRKQEFASLVKDGILDGTKMLVRPCLFYSPTLVGSLVITALVSSAAWVAFRVLPGLIFAWMDTAHGGTESHFALFLAAALVIVLAADGVASFRGRHFLRGVQYLEERGPLRLARMHLIGLLELVLGVMAFVCFFVVLLVSALL